MSAVVTWGGHTLPGGFIPRTVTSAHTVPANYARLYRRGVVVSAGAGVTVSASGEMVVL